MQLLNMVRRGFFVATFTGVTIAWIFLQNWDRLSSHLFYLELGRG